jgi:integrase/recombinase XerD
LPGTIGHYLGEHIRWLEARNYAARTLEQRSEYVLHFAGWCEQRGLVAPEQVTKPILERYQRMLFEHRQDSGKPLSFGAQHHRISALRTFFRWLTRQNVLGSNPASELELPRTRKSLPKHVLTAREVESILSLPDTRMILGLRDRAILEVLYATAIRRSELVGLGVFDLDLERGTLFVRQGKGQKDRVVPLGERALAWVQTYLLEARPELVVASDEQTLFLGTAGEALGPTRLTEIVREYVLSAGLGKRGACHLLRHTAATLMLENGADIRFIQHLLGHADLRTTQIYTQVSIRMLKEVHQRTHPGARLVPQERPSEAAAGEAGVDEGAALLALLAAEGEEEDAG